MQQQRKNNRIAPRSSRHGGHGGRDGGRNGHGLFAARDRQVVARGQSNNSNEGNYLEMFERKLEEIRQEEMNQNKHNNSNNNNNNINCNSNNNNINSSCNGNSNVKIDNNKYRRIDTYFSIGINVENKSDSINNNGSSDNSNKSDNKSIENKNKNKNDNKRNVDMNSINEKLDILFQKNDMLEKLLVQQQSDHSAALEARIAKVLNKITNKSNVGNMNDIDGANIDKSMQKENRKYNSGEERISKVHDKDKEKTKSKVDFKVTSISLSVDALIGDALVD